MANIPIKRNYGAEHEITALEQSIWNVESAWYYHSVLYPVPFQIQFEHEKGEINRYDFIKEWPQRYEQTNVPSHKKGEN